MGAVIDDFEVAEGSDQPEENRTFIAGPDMVLFPEGSCDWLVGRRVTPEFRVERTSRVAMADLPGPQPKEPIRGTVRDLWLKVLVRGHRVESFMVSVWDAKAVK